MNQPETDQQPDDYAGELYAPPPEPRPTLETVARKFVQHPTLENFLPLKQLVGRN